MVKEPGPTEIIPIVNMYLNYKTNEFETYTTYEYRAIGDKMSEQKAKLLSDILAEIDPGFKLRTVNLAINHVLKSWPQYFRAMRQGMKRFDMRKREENRHFDIGQYIILREWSPSLGAYSGEWDIYFIQFVLHGPMAKEFGVDLDADIFDVIHVMGTEPPPESI